jgi:hypothetical protein
LITLQLRTGSKIIMGRAMDSLFTAVAFTECLGLSFNMTASNLRLMRWVERDFYELLVNTYSAWSKLIAHLKCHWLELCQLCTHEAASPCQAWRSDREAEKRPS